MWRCFFILTLLLDAAGAADYSKQIKKATLYLSQNLHKTDAGMLGPLKVMIKKYNLKLEITEAQMRIMRKYPDKARLWLSGIEEGFAVSELEIRALRGIPWLIAAAMHCDKYPLPWDFVLKMRQIRERGGIGITRSLFAIYLVESKGCTHNALQIEEEKEILLRNLPEVVQRNPIGYELWSECLLALYFADRRSWITKDLLELLVSEQAEDGSWRHNFHDTVKSLWVLLEDRDAYETRQREVRQRKAVRGN
mgnify:CR=1 FL=1